MPKLKKFLHRFHCPNWLLILLTFVIVLRIPSFFMPYSYGDESIYLTLGEGIRQGVPLYSQLHDNKPPLLYVTAAIAGNLFWFKAILCFWNLITIVLFWKLVKKLYPDSKNRKLRKVATIVFALITTLPLLEGNIANAEVFMIGPTILAFLFLLSKKLTKQTLLISGALFSLATLFKVPAAFEVPAIIIFWFIRDGFKVKNIKENLINSVFLMIGFATPIILTFIWYYFQGALKDYAIAAFLQNVGYLSSWRANTTEIPFIQKNAPLIIRAAIVALGTIILFVKRNQLPKTFILITIWLLLGLFGVTLSERPYPHYLIQVAAPASILFAILTSDKTIFQTIAVLPLALTLFVPVYYHYWHYPTLPYYQRFIQFSFGKINKDQYLRSFSPEIPRNYQISKFVASATLPGDKIFVWGDDAKIYALSRRLPPIKFVADYHINDFGLKDDVISTLRSSPPSVIVILPEAKEFKALIAFTKEDYTLIAEYEGAEIWKRMVFE